MKPATTPTELRALLVNGWTAALGKKQRLPQPMVVTNHWRDELWSTEKHFVVRTDRLRGFFEKHELAMEPGVVYLDASRPYLSTQEPPDLDKMMDRQYVIEIEPARFEEHPILFEQSLPGQDTFVAVYRSVEAPDDGKPHPAAFTTGIRLDWLTFLTAEIEGPYGTAAQHRSYGTRLCGPARLMTEGPEKAIAIWCKRETKRGGYNEAPGKWVPETWHEDDEPYLLGVVMPTKV